MTSITCSSLLRIRQQIMARCPSTIQFEDSELVFECEREGNHHIIHQLSKDTDGYSYEINWRSYEAMDDPYT